MLKYTFQGGSDSFFGTLKGEVDRYFCEKKIDSTGNRTLYIKSSLQILSATGLYVVLVFMTPAIPISLLFCVLLGINLALIGFNVMHEGGHQSFSHNRWINQISAYFLNVLGGSAYYWKIKHNINHHTYTNIEGMDSDIDVKPFMRLHEGQPRHRYHRFQHVYWFVLYGISYLAWVFYEDFQKYFSGKVSVNMEKKALSLQEHCIFWFTKFMFVAVYMVVPIVVAGWIPWLIGFFVVTFICGLVISIVFQLAHVVPITQFHEVPPDQHPREWAAHQIVSTSNFATSSKWLHWLLGGLNFQIEHHLFPRISHVHYPAISHYVRRACKESNIVYNEYTSLFKAVRSHLRHLRVLGKE